MNTLIKKICSTKRDTNKGVLLKLLKPLIPQLKKEDMFLCLVCCIGWQKYSLFDYLFSSIKKDETMKYCLNTMVLIDNVIDKIENILDVKIDDNKLLRMRSYNYKLLSHCILDGLLYDCYENRGITFDWNKDSIRFELTFDIFSKMLKKYPSIVFLTTFYHYLPHIYINNIPNYLLNDPLLSQSQSQSQSQSPQPTDNNEENDEKDKNDKNDINDVSTQKELSLHCKQCLVDMFQQFSSQDEYMTTDDMARYIVACGAGASSAGEQRLKRIFTQFDTSDNKEDSKNNLFHQNSFCCFYLRACISRWEHVSSDLAVFHNFNEQLCDCYSVTNKNSVFYEAKSNRIIFPRYGNFQYDEVHDIDKYLHSKAKYMRNYNDKHSIYGKFAQFLNDKIVDYETLLIEYFINNYNKINSKNDNINSNSNCNSNKSTTELYINKDVCKIIFQMLHPINLMECENNYDLTMVEYDDKIRYYFKYLFDWYNLDCRKVHSFFYHSYFCDTMFKRLKIKYNEKEAKKLINEIKNTPMTFQEMRIKVKDYFNV